MSEMEDRLRPVREADNLSRGDIVLEADVLL